MAQKSKREAILETAGNLFVSQGYRKVSIDQIVETVPISKPTLYAHFKDKRELFSAVISARCARLLSSIRATVDAGKNYEETLFDIGFQFLTMLQSEQAINMHRTLVSEVADFPEIGKLFFESGPKQMHGFLKDYLSKLHASHKLHVEDAGLSADMFLSMIKGYPHLQCLLGVAKPLNKKQLEARVSYALGLFLKAHAPRPAHAR